jgi:hypothetical protein
MRPKLTEEDVAWLEKQLSASMVPVAPRAAFVHDVKQAVLNGTADAGDYEGSSVVGVLSALMLVLGLALFVLAIARRRMQWLR